MLDRLRAAAQVFLVDVPWGLRAAVAGTIEAQHVERVLDLIEDGRQLRGRDLGQLRRRQEPLKSVLAARGVPARDDILLARPEHLNEKALLAMGDPELVPRRGFRPGGQPEGV